MKTPATLEECTKENTPRWNFNGLSGTGKVTSVYDGDTITIAFNTHGLGFFQHNIRLLGIDAPEMRGSSEEEKTSAINARNYLRTYVLGQTVNFNVSSTDKYGRLLAKVSLNDIDISQTMIQLGHARAYNGGTRATVVNNH